MSTGAQNMKIGPDVLGIDENESRGLKHETWTRRRRYRRKWVCVRKTWKVDSVPLEPSKTGLGAQNMKSELDALVTVKNESERVKHEKLT
jgi:hypothetical protein